MYLGIREGLSGQTKLVKYNGDLTSLIFADNKDHYVTLFQYDEFQKDKIVAAGNRTAGITNTTTNFLFFDLDDAADVERAAEDARTLVQRLLDNKFQPENILCTFSGKKGFGVYVKLDYTISNAEFKAITQALAGDLETFDQVVSDPNRIIRAVNTCHQGTNLFKIPLSLEELDTLFVEDIKKLATSKREFKSLQASKVKFAVKAVEPVKKIAINVADLDWTSKPTFLTNCRYALQNGYIGEGERNNALLVLAATYKNLGFDIDHTYRLLKGVCEIESKRNNRERFADAELYNNICLQVYSPTWRGGQSSCKQDGWLKSYCEKLGHNKCSHADLAPVVEITDVFSKVVNFAKNIEKNTIKTGIPELDSRMRLITGQHTAILGAPSSGKSSLALQLLENTSLAGVNSIFFSMDMSDIITTLKLSSRVSNLSMEDVIATAKNNSAKLPDIQKGLNERYKNVRFCFRNGLSIENIREIIVSEKKSKDVKLIVVDYATRILGPWSDSNANGVYIANGLRSIANEFGIQVVTLVQPPKSAGDARDEITSMRQIKGSSVFEESIDNLIAVYRPGFDSNNSENDRYLVMPILKHRLGELFTLNFRWEGRTGSIKSCGFEDEETIKELMEKNRSRGSGNEDGWS